MDELAIYANVLDTRSIAVLYAEHYSEFAKAASLLIGSEAIGELIRQHGNATGPGETVGFDYGLWHFKLTRGR